MRLCLPKLQNTFAESMQCYESKEERQSFNFFVNIVFAYQFYLYEGMFVFLDACDDNSFCDASNSLLCKNHSQSFQNVELIYGSCLPVFAVIASIPTLHVNYQSIAFFYSTLKLIFPQTEGLVENIMDNRGHWIAIKEKVEARRHSITSLEIFDYIDTEEEKEAETKEQ